MENEIIGRLETIENRIKKLEETLFGQTEKSSGKTQSYSDRVSFPEPPPVNQKREPLTQSSPMVFHTPDRSGDSNTSGASRFLGVIGIICFILAAGFLVKLAIDSGWLTPERQVFAAGIFGILLIAIGLKFKDRDANYFSLLPAAGIVILYLTVGAGNRYFDLYNAEVALVLASIVSVVSLYLYTRLSTETYVAVSTVGTYLSVFLIPDHFDAILQASYFLIWDISFAILSVKRNSRSMLLLASYLSLGMYQWSAELHSFENLNQQGLILVVQVIQFFIFSFALVNFSTRNKPLTEGESWTFFPILLFFYGIEYSTLTKLFPLATPWIAMGFSLAVYLLYHFAAKRSTRSDLESGPMIYAFTAIVFFHALYLEILPTEMQNWLGVLFLLLPLLSYRQTNRRLWPIAVVWFIVVAIGYLRSLVGASHLLEGDTILLNLSFGGLLLILFPILKSSAKEDTTNESWVILGVGSAHLQILFGSYRALLYLCPQLGVSAEIIPFAISFAWGLFGIIVLIWAKKRQDKVLAHSALLILFVSCAKLFLYDVSKTSPLVRVLCFLITGTVLYSGGYLLRKVNQWTN